ncbi:UDP-N-acetylmuramoyl-tripeptide--D-alanyl-D-alanine ligase [Lonepinella sp. MS14435]|uniref:UDP-N-acetylmuramoyl-tripeptide--D-alanyl-D- alanine ligase n=1 Tax=Lonepinella sp. MS14435 TaxID=3003618 RepID=UPI0036DDC312
MIKLTTKKIAEILNSKLIGNAETQIENISTDTRQQTQSGLFFALKGERFDAHHYLEQAMAQGNVVVIVDHECTVNVPQIIVPDTRLALGQLAQWLKAKLNPLTVAMTGSSGKTTVKEMTASILAQTASRMTTESAVEKNQVLFTHGNFNNDIGVPLTLLRLTEKHQFAVIELGANHRGEIDYTTHLVKPNVALINNIAPAHLEGFGSIEGVAQAKGEIFRGLSEKGVAIVNLDCHYLDMWKKEIGTHKLQSFSAYNKQADFYASNVKATETGSIFILHSPQGEIEINLPYLGEHNVANALAATALAVNVGATLQEVKLGLEQQSFVKGRLFPIQPCENLLLLDDTYNANVGSLKSAIDVLQKYAAFRIFVVGDMAELGENTQSCHQQIADYTAQAQLECVVSFGLHSAVISHQSAGQHFTDKAVMANYLTPIIKQKLANNQPVVLLAKGSRSQKMEDVIDILKENFEG